MGRDGRETNQSQWVINERKYPPPPIENDRSLSSILTVIHISLFRFLIMYVNSGLDFKYITSGMSLPPSPLSVCLSLSLSP